MAKSHRPAKAHYNLIAGESVERLAALSDGIFAVAMTLLVLDLRVPGAQAIRTDGQLRAQLLTLLPQLAAYMMSFLTLGIFWNGQQAQLNRFSRNNRHLTWVHLLFLFAVTMMPFSTKLLADFIRYRTALVCYWMNIAALGAVLYGSWIYAKRANLLKPDTTHEIDCAVRRRILTAQGLYAFGALLCIWDTYASIGFIALVQLNFVIAPPLGILRRI